MTHSALAPLIGAEFDKFLGAPVGEGRNGTPLSVLSALARLNVDPWHEARVWRGCRRTPPPHGSPR